MFSDLAFNVSFISKVKWSQCDMSACTVEVKNELTFEGQMTCECGNETLGSIKCGEFLD
jgi:hypothetical protein